MKFYTKVVAVSALATIISGCNSSVPMLKNYPMTDQQHMQATHHWEVLAKDVSKNVSSSDVDRPVHVASASSGNPFDKAFKSLLETQLNRSGIKVSKNKGDNIHLLEFDTQVIRHNDRSTFFPLKGSPILLAGGIYGISEIAQNTSTGAALGAATLGYHAEDIFGGFPNTEVLINTSIHDSHGLLVQRTSNIYYINDMDADHYHEEPLTSMEVVSQ